MTSDVGKAVSFYTRLFGWKAEEMDMGNMKYTIVKAGEKQVGGIYQQMPQQKGVPSNWLGYVSVENVDASADKAVSIGAKVLSPPMDIPSVGRWAVLADQQGAAIAAFRGSNPPTDGPTKPQAGEFCWDELLTRDTAQAKKFYTQLFGWSSTEIDMGPAGTYTLFKTPGTENDPTAMDPGGMMQIPSGAPYPPFWLHYVAVNDVDASARKVTELGGQVMMQPTDIPNVGRFAVGFDPTGAAFALFKSSR
jgi:predicted enzyme related to lactoylglutathione lyase